MYKDGIKKFIYIDQNLKYQFLHFYKINARISKSELNNASSVLKQNIPHILVLGIRKHCIILGNQLDYNFKYVQFLNRNVFKLSIDCIAQIVLNHLRNNKMPIFHSNMQNESLSMFFFFFQSSFAF